MTIMHKCDIDREWCISAVQVRGRLRFVGHGHSGQASMDAIRAGPISALGADQNLVDHRDRAVAPDFKQEDLARGGDPARERRDVYLVGNQNNGFPGRKAEQELPEFGRLRAGPVRFRKNEFSADRSSTGPRSRNRAVSRQRHHWLVRIRSTVTPAARIAAPIFRACSRPCASRLRWVVQSSSANFAGPARGATRPVRGWRRPARGWGLWAHGDKRGVIRTGAGVAIGSA